GTSARRARETSSGCSWAARSVRCTSSACSGRCASSERTACGPSMRKRPCLRRAERPASAATFRTRSERAEVSGDWSGRSVIAGRAAMSGRGGVDVLGEGVLGDLDQGGESRRVVDGELGEHAAVHLDTREAEALDEAVVGQAVGAGGSVDALDPELTEVALALLAVAEVVGLRVQHLLLRLAVQARALAAVAAGLLKDFPTLLMGVDRPLHACHVILLRSLVQGAGAVLPRGRSAAQQLLHALDISLGDVGVAAEATLAGGGLVLQQVAGARLLAHELARAGDADALLGTRVGLVLRH